MSSDTFYDIIRLVNAVVASLVFCALIHRGKLYFRGYDKQQKLLHGSFTLYALATAWGSVEAYNLNIPKGAAVFIFLAANLVALYAFIRYRGTTAFNKIDPV